MSRLLDSLPSACTPSLGIPCSLSPSPPLLADPCKGTEVASAPLPQRPTPGHGQGDLPDWPMPRSRSYLLVVPEMPAAGEMHGAHAKCRLAALIPHLPGPPDEVVSLRWAARPRQRGERQPLPVHVGGSCIEGALFCTSCSLTTTPSVISQTLP